MAIIGYMAATLTTISFLPQVMKVYKSKSTKDISFLMFGLFSTGVFLWLLYGFLSNDWPLIFANSVTFILSTYILACKIKYK